MIRTAIAGLGGFAQVHHACLLDLEKNADFRLIATCDPASDPIIPEEWRFAERGVQVHRSLEALLDDHDLDLMCLPVPIPLHAPMHRACVQRGVAVYLEKPPTLDPAELEEMIAVDAKASIPTWVGFNYIRDPLRQAIKTRLLAGEFGSLLETRLKVLWPRDHAYYTRASWAGRLLLDGRMVLDGPIGNAMAHYLHNLLHWCGTCQGGYATPTKVRANLLRYHPIQGCDTALIAAETDTGPSLRIAVSHACAQDEHPLEELHCERAVIRFRSLSGEGRAEITWHDGRYERFDSNDHDWTGGNLRLMGRLISGAPGRPLSTLEDSRGFVHLNALAHLSTGSITPTERDNTALVDTFYRDGILPYPAKTVSKHDLGSLEATISELAGVAHAKGTR